MVQATLRNVLESSWNVMTHGDAREGKWRGNWQMEWVASTLHTFTLPRNMVYPTLLPLMRIPRLPVVDWNWHPCRFKWTRPFHRKTKSGFCACAITFQTQSTFRYFAALCYHVPSDSSVRSCPHSPSLIYKRRIKSHLPFAGIIRSSPRSPRFRDKG